MTHLMEEMRPERGTPHTVQHSPVGADGRCRKVVTKQPTLTVLEELIEDIATRSNSNNAGQPSKEAVVRKLLSKGECARIDLALDFLESLASAAQIALRWRTSKRGGIERLQT
jgi:hypothetical protein